MSFYFSLDKVTKHGDQTSVEKKVLKLDVDLLALRSEYPNAFLYMFLATTNAFGEDVDKISFLHGDEELPQLNKKNSELVLIHNIYDCKYKRPSNVSFLRPDILILSTFVRDQAKPLGVKAVKGDMVLVLNEPVQISEDEYLNGGFQKIDDKDQREINEEVNAIYKGRIAC